MAGALQTGLFEKEKTHLPNFHFWGIQYPAVSFFLQGVIYNFKGEKIIQPKLAWQVGHSTHEGSQRKDGELSWVKLS